MMYDITARVAELRTYYAGVLADRIKDISELSGVDTRQLIPINPADFIERNKYQFIQGYKYQEIQDWITRIKTDDKTFLISPLDAIEETAAQVSYKSATKLTRTLRASKCLVLPCPVPVACDFFIRNHRQSPPQVRGSAVCFALVYTGEIVAVMLYDISNGAVRGKKKDYELVRLAISKGTRVHGGASKLQAACENTLRDMGITKIYSYSNATINSGAVYAQLGFRGAKVQRGQTFVMMEDNRIKRLIDLYPGSTDRALAAKGRIKVHLGGNLLWTKEI